MTLRHAIVIGHLVVIYNLSPGDRSHGLPNSQADALADEVNRAIAVDNLNAAGMQASAQPALIVDVAGGDAR